jgi:hypothetical protein
MVVGGNGEKQFLNTNNSRKHLQNPHLIKYNEKMKASKRQKEVIKVDKIVERFKNLTTQELTDKKTLFGGSLSSEFKKAINQILKSRGGRAQRAPLNTQKSKLKK